MENHPIPQDVTGFQFKLVGNMTLKQFGYVGAGAILAVVLYYAPILWLIKFPLVLFFGLTGIGLAFVQIEGRPMDVMISNFVKAVLRPNQYAYHKIGGHLSFTDLELHSTTPQLVAVPQLSRPQTQSAQEKAARLQEYLYGLSDEPKSAMDEQENKYLSMFNQPAANTMSIPVQAPVEQMLQPAVPATEITPEPAVMQQPVAVAIPTASPVQPPEQMQATAQVPTTQPEQYAQVAPEAPQQTRQFAPIPPYNQQSVQPLVPQPEVPQQNQPPVQEPAQTVIMPQEPIAQQAPPVQPSVQPASPADPAAGAPAATGFPNLISGIIRDSRGNVLPGVLIDVKNSDGESVRAFKTNGLGQFASATQLTNGNYTIDFEDPKQQHKFQSVQVEVNGTILPPIVVTSIDAREELRRALFT